MVRLPWGVSFEVDLAEDIGWAVWTTGLYELLVCEVAWRLLRPGHLALDVGANIGTVTSLLAKRVGPTGRVVAFEPHPAVAEDLRSNMRRLQGDHDCAAVEVRERALGSRPGSCVLIEGHGFPRDRGGSHVGGADDHGIGIVQESLDTALGEGKASLVKMDVEGGELDVLDGARSALATGRVDNWIFEGHPEHRGPVIERFREHGYTVFALGHTLFRPLLEEPGSRAHLEAYETPNFLATRDPEGARVAMADWGWKCLAGKR